MRKKRKKAAAVIVDGIVHAIGRLEPDFDAVSYDERGRQVPVQARPKHGWDAFREYPLHQNTRAQRKADKVRAIRERAEPRVSLLCEPPPHMVTMPNGVPFRMPPWQRAPRTHAQVNCMSCLVAQART